MTAWGFAERAAGREGHFFFFFGLTPTINFYLRLNKQTEISQPSCPCRGAEGGQLCVVALWLPWEVIKKHLGKDVRCL